MGVWIIRSPFSFQQAIFIFKKVPYNLFNLEFLFIGEGHTRHLSSCLVGQYDLDPKDGRFFLHFHMNQKEVQMMKFLLFVTESLMLPGRQIRQSHYINYSRNIMLKSSYTNVCKAVYTIHKL